MGGASYLRPRLSLLLVGEGGPLAVDEVSMDTTADIANRPPEAGANSTLHSSLSILVFAVDEVN